MDQQLNRFWNIPVGELLKSLKTAPQGLTGQEAGQRLVEFGANLLKPKRRSDTLTLFLSQFKSPLILILLFAAALSFFLHDQADGLIILGIVLVSGLLGFWQEQGAANAVERLLGLVEIKATVLRNGKPSEIPTEAIVPGDVVVLNAGDVVPGDGLVIESKDLFVDEATLTGETFPVEKSVGVLLDETALSRRSNSVFMGTHVVSGTALATMVHTGTSTEFGKVSERLKLRPAETEFEHGVRRFGYFLMEITLVLVIAIFAINVYLSRPILDSFLFSLALAVGLTPQLLPAIVSINLAHGAKRMASQKVIVKRLASIENFGSMNVLCSDKTGTVTEGTVKLHSALGIDGSQSEKVLLYAYLNAVYETGFTNPIDRAIRDYRQFDIFGYQKLDEIPYDFIRKRLSILLSRGGSHLMVTKGALANVLAVCSSAETSAGTTIDLNSVMGQIQKKFEELSQKGFRTLGVAFRNLDTPSPITRDHECNLTFLGFLVFFDPPKPGISEAINRLKQLGISLKIITGDNRLVAANVSQQVGITHARFLTGSELSQMSDEALMKQVNQIDVFAEFEPNQKERIILALRKAGNVVGFMGDGINDASALHSADVGISVESAVDVAKEAADIVLLEKDLGVLVQGVQEGRKTFANTLKYVFMATSANFGNMFSMAGASLFLSFLPLLPKQILLTNLMTDFPEMTIATDSVDDELVEQPRRWNIRFIRNFMLTFGSVSSVFDYLTFGVLLLILHATTNQFRTGWFIESVMSAAIIVLVVRTRKPFFQSKPSKQLWLSTILSIGLVLLLPYIPLAKLFGFSPLPYSTLLAIGLVIVLYVVTAELIKKVFYRRSAY